MDIKYLNLENELERFFKDVIKQSRDNLKSQGINASRSLSKSLGYAVKENKNSFEADLLMEDYGEFIDKGVKGVKEGRSLAGYRYTDKKPPVRFLKTWLKQKSGKFRQRNQESIAYAIQNTIYRRGIRPTEFFSKPFEKEFKTLPDELIEAYGLDVEGFMNFVLDIK